MPKQVRYHDLVGLNKRGKLKNTSQRAFQKKLRKTLARNIPEELLAQATAKRTQIRKVKWRKGQRERQPNRAHWLSKANTSKIRGANEKFNEFWDEFVNAMKKHKNAVSYLKTLNPSTSQQQNSSKKHTRMLSDLKLLFHSQKQMQTKYGGFVVPSTKELNVLRGLSRNNAFEIIQVCNITHGGMHGYWLYCLTQKYAIKTRVIGINNPTKKNGNSNDEWCWLSQLKYSKKHANIVAITTNQIKTTIQNCGNQSVLMLCYPNAFSQIPNNLEDSLNANKTLDVSDSSIAECINAFKGETVVHIGELIGFNANVNGWGRTSNKQTQFALLQEFHKVFQEPLTAQWTQTRDCLSVWKRNKHIQISKSKESNKICHINDREFDDHFETQFWKSQKKIAI